MTKINWQGFDQHLGRISEILKKIDFNDLEQADILMNEIESVKIKRNNSLKKIEEKLWEAVYSLKSAIESLTGYYDVDELKILLCELKEDALVVKRMSDSVNLVEQ